MDFSRATQKGRDVVVSDVRFFDFAQTLDCGQAFRWRAEGGGFVGVAHGRRVEILRDGGDVLLKNMTLEEFEKTWRGYFDFSRDYDALRADFAKNGGEPLRLAMEFSPGLRLLRQDTWEILVSFILSQNSNIPRIKKMVETLCEAFGEKLECGGYAFPAASRLAQCEPADLAGVRAGYRAVYIIDAARCVDGGEFDIAALRLRPTAEIRDALLKIHGIGPKVADCVLLYGFCRAECYPADVWIKRAMAKFYPDGFPQEIKNHSGIAQQFLFHYARMVGV